MCDTFFIVRIIKIQVETYQMGASLRHGDTGPIKVSYGGLDEGLKSSVGQQYLEVAAAYDKERGFITDSNDFTRSSCNGYTVCSGWIVSYCRRLKADSSHGPSSVSKASHGLELIPFFTFCRYIDTDTGRRSDTAHHFIYNQAPNTNLQVMERCRVKRVIIKYGLFSELPIPQSPS